MSSVTGTDSGISLYEKVAENIRRKISEGGLGPGQLVGTEHALARESRISRMTIRRASQLLLDQGILERRPGKGLFVRHRIGSTSAAIPALQTRVIRLVAGNLQWEPALQISRGILSTAKQRGIQLQLCDAHGDAGFDLEMLNNLPNSDAHGAIIITVHSPEFSRAIYRLSEAKFPFVLIDGQLKDIDVPAVLSDNYAGGLQVGQYLLGKGHRRIAFIGDLIASTVQDRLAGLRDAVSDAQLVFDRSLVIDLIPGQDRIGDWSMRVEDCVRTLMQRKDRPTAIFCSCDAVARLAYRGLTELGLQVPRDVSLVGFDDDPLAEWLTPALTTVKQSFQEMGVVAAEMVCKRIESQQNPIEQRKLAVRLVERQSVASPLA